MYLARENVNKNRKKANENINVNRYEIKYKEGDLVTVRARNQSDALKGEISKFFNIFYGPFKIKKCIGKYSYILEDLNNVEKSGRYNIKDIHKYYPENK